ncbi:MBL fold metallo-hydrolase [Hoeflea sp. TYP-13]|uniref:MBL fold metallo-hydrolase n=1 Tax=Hoeflea sp. TYP-13 TaxID=3230023 RepID=UPI0034C619E0
MTGTNTRNFNKPRIERRSFLLGSAALLSAGALWPIRARASQPPAIEIGSKTVSSLSDGNLVLPMDFIFRDVPQDELQALLKSNGYDATRLEPECNVTVLRDGERLVLFDVGAGSNFMPSAGRLPASLEEAGIAPEDVTDVVFTHAHPDHIWGLLDDFDELAFPEARYHMNRTEWDYWRADDTLEKTPDARKTFVIGAQNRMVVLEDQIELFEYGAEVVPGVEAVDTAGHTPGHTSFAAHDGSNSVMILGDAVANLISFERPGWASGSDQDAQKGIETRRRLLDRLASDKAQVVGFHLPESGIGTVETNGAGYRFIAG